MHDPLLKKMVNLFHYFCCCLDVSDYIDLYVLSHMAEVYVVGKNGMKKLT
jgi:hypothetical protein